MASLNVKTEYSEYKDCKLRVGKYVEDNSVAVEIYNRCYVRKSRRRHVGVQGTLFSEWIDGGRTLR